MSFTLIDRAYTVRQARRDDLTNVVDIDQDAFRSLHFDYDVFLGWLRIFPEGFRVVTLREQVVAYCMTIRINAADITDSFALDTGGGSCVTHNPRGDVLYGVSIAARERAYRAYPILFAAMRERVYRDPHLKGAVTYCRLPGLAMWMREEYPDCDLHSTLVKYLGERTDPVQRLHELCGGITVRGIVNYLPEDTESLGCAAQVLWASPRLMGIVE